MSGGLPAGVYESLRTAGLDRALSVLIDLEPAFASVEPAEAPEVLARHVSDVVRRALSSGVDEADRIAIINRLMAVLNAPDDRLADEIVQLVELAPTGRPSIRRLEHPVTPLSVAALLTNAPDEPTLGAELRAELTSADRVDLLCAFIKWHGLRVLEAPLMELRDRGVPFRVITTTYVGATERRAIDELVRRFGADVKITYETQSTRLHAKAWLLRRESGFDTAFVGSSNLSRSALVDGLEWNVRLSGVATPELIRKFAATFDSYWADAGFMLYNPDTDADRLDDALAGSGSRRTDTTVTISGLEVRPLPHQVEILEALEAERSVHGRHRNLVVAATGTGKTVVAALDYQRFAREGRRRPSLLFVAHRQEILQQSLRMYREVLMDANFGELYVGGSRPERWDHVFASVQSLTSYGVDRIPPDHFDIVVIDEFHHAEASTYRRIIDRLHPRELLGMTATPERSDGVDVRTFFEGRTAYELRLWDALSADLLVPFHYFGIADDVDLTDVAWKRGQYDVEILDRVYTGNDARAAKVLAALRDKVTDVHAMRALGFCASVAHAHYMASVFQKAGISAAAVSGSTSPSDRASAIQKLRAGEVKCLFAADLFNEGLDIPEVDTVLFLRPTQSATLFLQQLGRGLRRSPGKAVLTALDFIGHHRREFRFDTRYRPLTGATRRGLERQIELGFPFLPSGSQLVLDRVSQAIVLENVRAQLRLSRNQLAVDLRSYGDPSLAGYLADSGQDVADVYRGRQSWTDLRRRAGLPTARRGPDEEALLRRVVVASHVDDPERARVYTAMADPDGPLYGDLDSRQQRLARMLFFALWPNRGGFDDYAVGFLHLRKHPAVCAELVELVALSLDRGRLVPQSLGEGLDHIPMFSHARYRREEILAGLGWASLARSARGNITGVAWCEETQTDALLINLRKTEREFSPTTMYRDFAISPALFHWESQNATSAASEAGRRYVTTAGRETRVVLFVREAPSDELGAATFLCLGQARYAEHRGDRPMEITWRLDREMPGELFRLASVVAS